MNWQRKTRCGAISSKQSVLAGQKDLVEFGSTSVASVCDGVTMREALWPTERDSVSLWYGRTDKLKGILVRVIITYKWLLIASQVEEVRCNPHLIAKREGQTKPVNHTSRAENRKAILWSGSWKARQQVRWTMGRKQENFTIYAVGQAHSKQLICSTQVKESYTKVRSEQGTCIRACSWQVRHTKR